MKNLKNLAVVILAVIFTFTQLPYTLIITNANNVQETVKKDIGFMPPNPDIYSYKKGNSVSNHKNQLSSLNNTNNIKNVAPLKAPVLNGGNIVKVLVIPIQFKDVSFSPTYNQQYFQNILSGSENSLKEYYERNSGYYLNSNTGITVDSTVSSIVTSTRNMSYYGQDSSFGIDDANGDVAEMAREAVNILDAKGFDFSQFDSDGDKVIDHIMIIHAGDGQEMVYDNANTLIWSHRAVIGNVNYNDYRDGQLVDGVYAYNYSTVSEASTLGTYCHEFGHDLGLPDLYDPDGNSNGYTEGVGDWDVMGSGSWNTIPGEPAGSCPANLSAWSKFYLGWISPVEITNNTSVNISNTDGNSSVYRLWPNGDINSNEYFLVEFRRRAAYDAGIPGEGVLVWHIDRQKTAPAVIENNEVNNDDQRLGVELEQADGQWDLWFAGNIGDDGDPFPGSTENYNFIGAPYGIKIYNGEKFYNGEATITYTGNTLYGANYSNLAADKSTNVELRDISISGANATMDCTVKVSVSPDNKPLQMSPYDAGIVDINPVFTWGITSDAKTFKLQIAESSNFEIVLRELNLDRTTGLVYTGDKFAYILSDALDNGKTYYWRVAGVNDNGTGVWSDTRSFKTVNTEGTYIWNIKANMITGRQDLGVVSLDGKIYAIGGYGGGDTYYSALEEYNPVLNTWTTKTPMSNGRSRMGVVALNGKIYAIGGYAQFNQWQTTVEVWDSATNEWSTLASMPTGRNRLCAVAVGGKIYAIGGRNSDGLYSKKVEVYDPETNSWTNKADIPVPYAYQDYLAVAANNTIYVFAGGNVYEYNIDLDTWTLKGTKSLPYFGTVTELNGKIYFIGGDQTAKVGITEYDPVTNSWNEIQVSQEANSNIGAAAANGRIYAVGGFGTNFTSSAAIEYIPDQSAPSVPTNLQSITSGSAITVTWDNVQNATGYYIMVDGIENYSTTNIFAHTGLAENSRHEYIIRSVNANYSSDWSEPLYARTTGAPEISVDVSGIAEGSEDGGNIDLTLTNGVFRQDGVYNRATVSINPNSIPAGIKQGEVTRISDTKLNIKLAGNSTVDYDTNLSLYITVAKELITTGRYENSTGAAIILAVVEPEPGTPDISFSFTGENAGKLVGSTTSMEYSLGGGEPYLGITDADMLLTAVQINSINATNDIRVRYKAGTRTNAGADKIIDILPGPAAPNVTGDNSLNVVNGINNTMEFSTDGVNWTSYNVTLPDLTGNVTLKIRIPAKDQTIAGSATTLTFTNASSTPTFPGVGLPVVIPQTGSTVVNENEIAITPEINKDTGVASSELENADLLKAKENADLNKDGVKTIIVEVQEIKDAKGYVLVIPASEVSTPKKDLIFDIVTSIGTLHVPSNILKPDKNAENIEISIAYADLSKLDNSLRKKIGNKLAVELTMTKDGETFTWNNPDAPLTVSLDYRPTAEELKDPDHIVVWYIDSNGNVQAVPNAKYDTATGKVTFKTTHFSKYVIAYNNVKFNDLSRFKWAENQIEVMASKGVISDQADGNFNPEQNITRGMLIDYIVKSLGLTASFKTNFGDVKETDIYYESVGIAKKLGIISGTGQNKFNPNTEITRQDMMTIVNKALSVANKISSQGSLDDIAKFEDTNKIAQYAIQSVTTMVKEGIISGTGKMIDPTGKVTKAQAAVIAYKCYYK